MSDLDLAYIAGFFDGEGSVVITQGERKRLVLSVVVVQTDVLILHWVRSILGREGAIHSRSREGSLGSKPIYALQWSAASAARVLETLLPYLKVKKAKAEIALDFQRSMTRKHCGRGTPSEVLDFRAECREKIKHA